MMAQRSGLARHLENEMNAIDYIAPARRDDNGAQQFAAILAATLSWTPEDFGGEYAWDAPIPAADRMQAEADSLQAHLETLA